MHRAAKAVVAAVGALLLCGQALGEEIRIPRKGSSPGFDPSPAIRSSPAIHPSLRRQRRDSARCWKLAEEAKSTGDRATQNVLVGYLIGGVIGALIASSVNPEAYEDRKGTSRRQVYDECMAKRRYPNDD